MQYTVCKGTLKYHMSLRFGGRGFAQTVRVPSYVERRLSKSAYNF